MGQGNYYIDMTLVLPASFLQLYSRVPEAHCLAAVTSLAEIPLCALRNFPEVLC